MHWTGAHTVDIDEEGWATFWRIPPSQRQAVADDRFWEQARIPAGVSARWHTDAATLIIEVRATSDAAPIDIVVDGELRQRLACRHQPAGITHRVDLPARPATVDVWLPHSGQVTIRRVEFVGGNAAPVPRTGARWIAYGSSITQCGSAEGPSETWPALVAREHGWRLTCLGFGGQCHLDPVVARTIRDTPAELISLCLGINIYNRSTFSARTLRPQIIGFLQTIRDGHPGTPVVVITPIASQGRDDEPNAVGLTLREVRAEVTAAVSAVTALGDEHAVAVDGRFALGQDEAGRYLHDGLHPSAAGYRLMAERLAPTLGAALTQALTPRSALTQRSGCATFSDHARPQPG